MTFGADWTVKLQSPFAQTGLKTQKQTKKQTQKIFIINLLAN